MILVDYEHIISAINDEANAGFGWPKQGWGRQAWGRLNPWGAANIWASGERISLAEAKKRYPEADFSKLPPFPTADEIAKEIAADPRSREPLPPYEPG